MSSLQALRRSLAHGGEERVVEDALEAYPGQREQRLSFRLLSYWRHLRGTNEFAARSQIDPAVIAEMWPYCFILEIPQGAEAAAARYSYVGAEIARLSHVSTAIISLAEPGENTLLSKASLFLDLVLVRRVPITMGGTFRDPKGSEVLYRSIMLPLSDDQRGVSAVLGAANCKEKSA